MIFTNILAALPLKQAAVQQDICRKVIAQMCQSCIAAKYLMNRYIDVLPDNSDCN
jgi:hypothetical protein